MEVTDFSLGDAPLLPGRLGQVSFEAPIASIGADEVYDARACHAALAQREGKAVIPLGKRATQWRNAARADVQVRNEAVLGCQRLRSSVWATLGSDHRRILLEIEMQRFQRTGQRFVARTFRRQVAESL